jgi:Ca2+/Na+ antiporter
MQLYVLAIAYLLFGAGILLADSYGLSFALLLSMRYAFRTKRVLRRLLIVLGMVITLGLGFFPMDPGPVFLGDFVPMLNIFSLMLYYVFRSIRGSEDGNRNDEGSVLDATGRYMEQNKRNVGFLTVVVAIVHFLAPQLVLL